MAMTPPTTTSSTACSDDVQQLARDLAHDLVEREPLPHERAKDEATRCKYSSKKCFHVRARKAKGELHLLCAFHRAKAILNQRRLEARKRAQQALKGEPVGASALVMLPPLRLAEDQAATATATPIAATDADASQDQAHLSSYEHMAVTVTLEPFRDPVMLHPEDLEALVALVDMDVSSVACCHS